MSGYTPLFDSLTTGTLCGRWPDIGLWPIVLSMCDRNGLVDVTPAYISGVTGLSIEEVVACMKRFCQPDPYSRSPAEAGARLALIDQHRDWGWKVVNHAMYREKARKQMQQIEFTASGRDADRKRIERERKANSVQSRPAESSADRLSDSDSDTEVREEIPRARAPKGGRGISSDSESPEARKERIQEAIAKFKQYRDAPSTLAMLTKTTVEEVKTELEAFIGAQGRSTLFADLAQRKKV